MRREIFWHATFAPLAGLLLGAASALAVPVVRLHLPWTAAYVLLGALAALVVIPLEPHGSLNLAPVVFLVVALISGPWEGVIVAATAPILAAIVSFVASAPRQSSIEAISNGGEVAFSLSVAVLVVGLFPQWARERMSVLSLPVMCLATMFVLQVVRVSVFEGVKTRRLLGPILRSSLPHVVSFVIAVALIWVTYQLIGPLGVFLTSIVAIEMYYPWKLLGEQRDLFLKSLQMVSNAVDLKDPYTAHHSRRVSTYATKMARVLGVPEVEVERIRIGALMHDIGKIGVPGDVIRKPSKLTDEEMAVMKSHVESGASIVEELEILNRSTDIVRYHHENYDGTGYPSGLAGQRIPLGARIVFVSDAFDALTTDRPYRKGRSVPEAVKVLEANINTQFDPRAVEALKTVLTLTS